MAYSAPPNFAAGAVLTEAQLDTLSDDITFLANPPKCRVYNDAAISHTTSGVAQVVTFNSERVDTDTMHSTAVNTGRITFTTAGFYIVGCTIEFAANATGFRSLDCRVNGTTYIDNDVEPSPTAATVARVKVNTGYQFAAGDYIEFLANQTSGAALSMASFPNASPEAFAVWVSL